MTRRRRPRTSEERLVAAVGSVARGVVGGRIRNVRQASPLERNTGSTATTGGFDPNADPIIIGPGASAGGTHAISIGDSATAAVNTIAFGSNALVTGTYGVAIGYSANVGGSGGANSVAIGHSADAHTDRSIAVGGSAYANCTEGVAVGYGTTSGDTSGGTAVGGLAGVSGARTNATAIGWSSSARADYATGLGATTLVAHAHSTAVGYAARSSAVNQIMLGTATEFVEIPGNGLVLTDTADGVTRYRITIASGAVAVNPA